METIIDRVLSHPLLSFILALICILLLFAVLKGLFRIILILFFLGLLFLGYVTFLQEDYPLPVIDDELTEKWNQWIEPYKSIDLNVTIFDLNDSIVNQNKKNLE